jgi:MoxR-like ATPase
MTLAVEALEQRLQQTLGATVLGMRGVIRGLLIAIVARGHVLVQGAPGLGKTLLAKSLAAALGGSFRRVQGTADLMPADIIGVHLFEGPSNAIVFRPGPIFADVLLVDEINRTGPKTQSALLEAMEERQVSLDRETYRLPSNFLVIATQNPRDFEGTYPLPESQLDRFMMRFDLAYPSREDEADVLGRYGSIAASGGAPLPAAVMTREAIEAARSDIDSVHVAPELIAYTLDLAQASREHPQVSLGLSTRGALAVLRAARVEAALRGSSFVSPDDVKRVLPWVMPHRLLLSTEAVLEGQSDHAIVGRLIEQVPVPR